MAHKMIDKLLEAGCPLPPGEHIISITSIRDGAIIITDNYIYEVIPDFNTGFTIRPLAPICI